MKTKRHVNLISTGKGKMRFIYLDKDEITSTVHLTKLVLTDKADGEQIKMFYILETNRRLYKTFSTLKEAMEAQKKYENKFYYKRNIYL